MNTGEHEGMIADHYKGMAIRVRARRFGQDAWTCTIRIWSAPHRALRTVGATLRASDHGVSRQVALMSGFIEAMRLCDLLLDNDAT
jgi:hypothetical protein